MTKSALTGKLNSSSGSSAKASGPSEKRSSRFELIKPNESGNLIQAPGTIGTEEFLREVVDACASCVAVLDESGVILYASRAWRLFEQSLDAKAQRSDIFAHCLRVDDAALSNSARPTSLRDGVQCLVAGSQKELHGTYSCADLGSRVVVRAARLNLPVSGFRILITFEDTISSREALRRAEERFRVLLEKTHILPWEADFPTRRFISVGAQAESMLGYPIEDWYQPNFWQTHLHPADRERAIRESNNFTMISDNYELDYRMIARDHREVWFHSLVTVIRENGRPKTVLGFSIDVTASRENEAELRDLSGRLIAAQEEERSRIARELHDGLNQRMALLSIELEQLKPELERPTAMRQRLDKLQEQVKEISLDIHRLSYKLHPAKLDHLGLAAAIESLCKELTDSGTLNVDLQHKGFRSEIPGDVTLCVFRIAQESLRNSSRHSGALSVQVVLEQTRDAIRLSVSDNGVGFDPESDQIKKGLGFISMKERLRLVEGDLRIYSQPLRGTRIEVRVPLKRRVTRKNDNRMNGKAAPPFRWRNPSGAGGLD
jgi:PAS domain S-box-containing protein